MTSVVLRNMLLEGAEPPLSVGSNSTPQLNVGQLQKGLQKGRRGALKAKRRAWSKSLCLREGWKCKERHTEALGSNRTLHPDFHQRGAWEYTGTVLAAGGTGSAGEHGAELYPVRLDGDGSSGFRLTMRMCLCVPVASPGKGELFRTDVLS